MSAVRATMRAAMLRAPGEVEVVELPVPRPGPGEVVVRVRACGICGSDLMDWYVSRRVPFVFGHEVAGEIASVGPDVEGFGVGDPVFVHHHAPCGTCAACRRGDEVHCTVWRTTHLDPGGMAEYVRVPGAIVRAEVLRLPPGVGFDDAALVEPVACAVKALRRAAAVLGGLRGSQDAPGAALGGLQVLVLGLGFSGQVLGTLARELGAERLLAADPVPARRARARRWADTVFDPVAEDLADVARADGVDLAVVATSSAQALEAAASAVRPGGVILLYAPLPPGVLLPLPAHDVFFREVTVVPSYSAGTRDTREALAYITRGVIRAAQFVTHRFPLERAGEAYRTARAGGPAIKVIVEGIG